MQTGVFFAILLMTIFTVYVQVEQVRMEHIAAGRQLQRHSDVLNGKALDPWQYRILSEYLVEGLIQLLKRVGFAQAVPIGFIAFRVLQNILLFSLAYLYYKLLSLTRIQALLGISLLAWGMAQAYYGADLTFNTYADIIFYLVAALIILQGRYWFIVPLVFVAALNRETSGLIPVMLLARSIDYNQQKFDKRILIPGIVSFVVFIATYISLRFILGTRQLLLPYGIHPGIEMFTYNVFRFRPWLNLFATLGILPVLAIISWRQWNYHVRCFFWAIVPLWFIIHFFVSLVDESRLFLVPQTLIFVPGALMGAFKLYDTRMPN